MLEELLNHLVEQGILVGTKSAGYKINPYLQMPISLGFEDVAIRQGRNICDSRLDVDITSEFVRGVYLKVPLIASNMSTVVNADFCALLHSLGALGIMHRAFANPADYLREVANLRRRVGDGIVAVSVGVGAQELFNAKELIYEGANVITIDIAHGFSEAVLETATKIKQHAPHVKVIVGNTTNVDTLRYYDGVADAIKVGLAQGLVCETKNTAGVTEKQFSATLKFKEEARKLGMPIISDGGIREPADFTKAIAAGANSVMAGSIFARCPESAAPLVEGKKLYAGMASRWVQDNWKGGLKSGTCPEGKAIFLDLGESAAALVERYSGALKSGVTYAGGKDIKSFQDNATFVRFK